MHAHPKMFRVYVTKNTSHFCGTNRHLSRIDPSVENVCPSCGCDDEPASHITRCEDEGRREMWRRGIADLVSWLSSTVSDCAFIEMIQEYLLAQSSKTMRDCLEMDAPALRVLAKTHD